MQRVEALLEEATWWNAFEHYSQGLVYEVRVPTGHGARWTLSDYQFIGFLDPFLDETR